jgi:hypothetical protein
MKTSVVYVEMSLLIGKLQLIQESYPLSKGWSPSKKQAMMKTQPERLCIHACIMYNQPNNCLYKEYTPLKQCSAYGWSLVLVVKV